MSVGGRKILLTRPETQSDEFISKLYQGIDNEFKNRLNISDFIQFKEHFFLICPVMVIKPRVCQLPKPQDLEGVIFTSARALTPDVLAAKYQDIPAYVVGQETAQQLQNQGFYKVVMIEPTAENLIKNMSAGVIHSNSGGQYLYLRGVDISVDIKSALPDVKIIESVVYEALALEKLPQNIIHSVKQDQVSWVLFFSPRSAKIFVDLSRDQGLGEDMQGIKALCISQRVLQYVRPWFKHPVYASERPDMASMLKFVHDIAMKEYTR